MGLSRSAVAWGIAALVSCAAAPARANGQFPAAAQIVVQPSDPQHLVVRATFGLLPSRDGGQTFDWICESGANYGSGLDPGIAMTNDGTLLAGVFGGVSTGRGDACDWSVAIPGSFIADVTIDRGMPSTAFAIGSDATGYYVWRSDDDATTWAELAPLPSGFYPTTIEVAPSDPSRLYAGGSAYDNGANVAALVRSLDGGATWETTFLPAEVSVPAPYIAGVDPTDAATVWVRPDVTPGVLLVTQDAGDTWATMLTTAGSLLAFAISPDGSTVLAGGPDDGLFASSAGPSGPGPFEPRSDVPATCLAWPDDRVFACVDEVQAGYAVGRSDDDGVSFTSILTVQCVRGPLDCASGSTVGSQCPSQWNDIATATGHDTCTDAGAPTSSSSGTPSSAAGSTTGASATAGGAGSPGGDGASSASGCGCRLAPRSGVSLPLIGIAVAAAALRRRHARGRRSNLG